jgi:predicted Zn-dependent protease
MTRREWIACLVLLFCGVVNGLLWHRRGAAPPRRSFGPVALARSESALAAGRHLEALRRMETAPGDGALAAPAGLLKGKAMVGLHYWSAAEAEWLGALQRDPTLAEAIWSLMDLYFVQERWTDARELAQQVFAAQTKGQTRAVLLLELLRQEFERLAPGDALVRLEPVLAREPDNSAVQRAAARCYVKVGRTAEAWPLLERACGAQPDDPENWRALAESLDAAGSIDRLDSVARNVPDSIRAHAWWLRYHAMALKAAAQPRQAAKLLTQAVRRDPYDRKAHYLLAELYRHLGEPEPANHHLNESRRLSALREELSDAYLEGLKHRMDPPAELCGRVGRLCRELGRVSEAEFWFDEQRRRSFGVGAGG